MPEFTGLQLRSLVKPDGELEITLAEKTFPAPGPDEVLVRVQATPINPSDLGMLFGPADLSTVKVGGTPDRPVVTARIPERAMPSLAARAGRPMPVGNEGAGVVVAAGASPQAQALMGRTVAAIPGGMYAQYRMVKAADCLALPDGTDPADAASCFVNPLTALGMTETMRAEGHTAIVHTAAASNLGQMLNRICLKDGIGLVCVVRSAAQAELLRGQGAKHVVDSTAPDFLATLTDAIAATGATIGFDAIGGGKLAGQILGCMEAALNRKATEFNRYGSSTHKQVYVYGSLDNGPTELVRNFGMAWGVGGWLLFPFLAKAGPDVRRRLEQRVVDELKTTFSSRYAKRVSLAQALSAAEIATYGRRATGAKYLIEPARG
jgi:NADPH:quinone reductase-like Zn-dependent oxidoreductase